MRNTILNELQQEMKDELYPGNTNYDIGTTGVYRGVYQFAEVAAKPCICIALDRDVLVREYAGYQTRGLYLIVYGYAETTEDIHMLAKDTEYFFLNDYSKKNDMGIGDLEFIEGKENESNTCYFDIDIKIQYNQKINSI